MKILIVHNRYLQRGGEDVVAEAEVALLRRYGHHVETYIRDNEAICTMTGPKLVQQTMWSTRTVKDLNDYTGDFRPDIVHVHNTFPLVSPSLFWAAARQNTPIVQTLHNFRLLCPQAMFLRNNSPCEDCLGTLPWRGIVHKCYHDSLMQSAVVAGMLSLHRSIGTYRDKVTRYIALNNFCKQKFIEGGLPADRISVKPNFVSVPAPPESNRQGGLFVGRLSAEKGTELMAEAAELCPGISIKVVGDGPTQSSLEGRTGIALLGKLGRSDVLEQMSRASYLVLPSLWYENLPVVLLEAFASALPVIAPRHGALVELVEEGRTGLLVDPGSKADLAQKIAWAEQHPEQMRRMGRAAREEYLVKYTPEHNHTQLMEIYELALNGQHIPGRDSYSRSRMPNHQESTRH